MSKLINVGLGNVINATSAPDSKSMAAFAKIKIY